MIVVVQRASKSNLLFIALSIIPVSTCACARSVWVEQKSKLSLPICAATLAGFHVLLRIAFSHHSSPDSGRISLWRVYPMHRKQICHPHILTSFWSSAILAELVSGTVGPFLLVELFLCPGFMGPDVTEGAFWGKVWTQVLEYARKFRPTTYRRATVQWRRVVRIIAGGRIYWKPPRVLPRWPWGWQSFTSPCDCWNLPLLSNEAGPVTLSYNFTSYAPTGGRSEAKEWNGWKHVFLATPSTANLSL